LVSFFDTIAYVVSFGAVGATRDDLVIFDIDPQADSPPHDLKITSPSKDPFPSVVVRPASSEVSDAQQAHLSSRFPLLIDHIESRQNVLYMTPVTERLNAARALPEAERHAAVANAVNGCRGHVLKLLKYMSEQLALKANTRETEAISNAITALIRMDPTSIDGLSKQARAAVSLAETYLVTAIEDELDGGPLTVERVILLLNGTPGAAVAFRAVMEPMLAALGISAESLGLPDHTLAR
jgi:hypothetical protein